MSTRVTPYVLEEMHMLNNELGNAADAARCRAVNEGSVRKQVY